MSRKRVRVETDTEIVIASNMRSSFSYTNERDVFLELSNFGDEEYISFGELRKLSAGRSKKVLQNMFILIIDVLDDNLTADDVIRQLKLDKSYNSARQVLGVEEDMPVTPYDFDDFIESASEQEINRAIDNHKFLRNVIIDGLVAQYKESPAELNAKTQGVLTHIGIDTDVYSYLEDMRQ